MVLALPAAAARPRPLAWLAPRREHGQAQTADDNSFPCVPALGDAAALSNVKQQRPRHSGRPSRCPPLEDVHYPPPPFFLKKNPCSFLISRSFLSSRRFAPSVPCSPFLLDTKTCLWRSSSPRAITPTVHTWHPNSHILRHENVALLVPRQEQAGGPQNPILAQSNLIPLRWRERGGYALPGPLLQSHFQGV